MKPSDSIADATNTLKELRAKHFELINSDRVLFQIDELLEIIDLFNSLDRHLTYGGSLPSSWDRNA